MFYVWAAFGTLELCLEGMQSGGGKCESNKGDFNVGHMTHLGPSWRVGGFWREVLVEVLSLWSTIKSYLYHTMPCLSAFVFVAVPKALRPPSEVALPPEHGSHQRCPVGLLLLALLK